MKESEARGLTHWLLYADSSTIFAYSIVHGNGISTPVLEGLEGVSSLAVDVNAGYLFVTSKASSAEKATIDRYDFAVDASSESAAVLTVDKTSAKEVYRGQSIDSVTIDAD